MASFQAKIGWKRMRKRENKNYHYVLFLPDAKFKIPKKFKNFEKCHYGFISSKTRLEKEEKE